MVPGVGVGVQTGEAVKVGVEVKVWVGVVVGVSVEVGVDVFVNVGVCVLVDVDVGVSVGMVVSTIHVNKAGVGSALPALSTARTWNVWPPLPRPL